MKLRIRNHLFFFYHYKTYKVYGVSSRVPHSKTHHYLLYDIDLKDKKDLENVVKWFAEHYRKYSKRWYITHNGFHMVIFKIQDFVDTIREMLQCPYIDKSWVALGIRRGYFFLQTYVTMQHKRFPLTYMEVDRIA